MALLGFAGYLMFQLNNVNALIRIFSRMVSCSYLVLMTMAFFLFEDIANSIISVLAIAFYIFFFSIYQEGRAVGRIFYAFAILGTMSVIFVQTLYFVPIIWVLLFTNIMAGNVRMIVASLLGLILPYWFIAAYGVFSGNALLIVPHFEALLEFGPLADWQVVSRAEILTLCFVALLSITGMIHFRLNNYKDKIRTRMLFEIFSVMNLCLMVFIALQPNLIEPLLTLLIVNTAPMIAHYIALTNTKVTNVSSYIIILITLGNRQRMDTLLNFLIDWGYWGMLVASFLAGSFFPFSSEAVMLALQAAGLEPLPLVIYATIGNALGSYFNYGVGRLGKLEWIEKYLHVSAESLKKAEHFMGGRGAFMGIFAFLPILGSAITIMLGLMKANIPIAFTTIAVGKLLRYIILAFGGTFLF